MFTLADDVTGKALLRIVVENFRMVNGFSHGMSREDRKRPLFLQAFISTLVPILASLHGHLGHAAFDHVLSPFIFSFFVLIIAPDPILQAFSQILIFFK